MKREELIALIKWTMTSYGSDADEKAQPGSKLQAQAEHIVNVFEAYQAAQAILELNLTLEQRSHLVLSLKRLS